jgi:DNA-binding NarL/FixJ family response regulator
MSTKAVARDPRHASAPAGIRKEKTEPYRVFIVEDHPITRTGLAALIGAEADLSVCGEADTAALALAMITNLKPDVVVTDIALKTTNGLELMKNIIAVLPTQRILAISMHDEAFYAERAIRAGARGYIMKREASDKIVPAIRVVLAGDIYVSEVVKSRLVANMVRHRQTEKPTLPMDKLSDREVEVFELIGHGFTTREIAARLHLSTKTIDSHREHLKIKLNLETGGELARHAIQWARLQSVSPPEA